MAARIVKELHGFSGTQILLMKKHDMLFVRKSGSVQRNVERMYALSEKYPLPKIYGYSKNNFEYLEIYLCIYGLFILNLYWLSLIFNKLKEKMYKK